MCLVGPPAPSPGTLYAKNHTPAQQQHAHTFEERNLIANKRVNPFTVTPLTRPKEAYSSTAPQFMCGMAVITPVSTALSTNIIKINKLPRHMPLATNSVLSRATGEIKAERFCLVSTPMIDKPPASSIHHNTVVQSGIRKRSHPQQERQWNKSVHT